MPKYPINSLGSSDPKFTPPCVKSRYPPLTYHMFLNDGYPGIPNVLRIGVASLPLIDFSPRTKSVNDVVELPIM